MPEEKIQCIVCGAEFLQSTADCSNGKCMPCYLGRERVPRPEPGGSLRVEAPPREPGLLDRIPAGIAFGCLMAGLMALLPASGIILALIARYLFQASWSTSLLVGFVFYLVAGFLGSIGDMFGAGADTKREGKLERFREKWRARQGSDPGSDR